MALIFMFKKFIYIISLILFLNAQDYKISAPQITGSQSYSTSDVYNLISGVNGQPSGLGNSDSLYFNQGILGITQKIYSQPPDITAIIADTIAREGMPISVRAILNDLNGIESADLHFQKGGSEQSIVIPMIALNDSIFETSIDESLITVNNFRAFIQGNDNMSYVGKSDVLAPAVNYGDTELSTDIESSVYPFGLPKERWRMISFPGKQKNGVIDNPEDDGHVFYSWSQVDSSWVVPDSIKLGSAYWFKHLYNEKVPFISDSGTAIPLIPYYIDLKKGWNMIGSPFAFPVEVIADPNEVSALYFFGDSTNKNGWKITDYLMEPWAGYAIHTFLDSAKLIVLPFPDSFNGRSTDRKIDEEWEIHFFANSGLEFDHSVKIGRKEFSLDNRDFSDTPLLPAIENGISVRLSHDNGQSYNHSADFRSLAESNGVWDVSILSKDESSNIQFSADDYLSLPNGLTAVLFDIEDRKVYTDFLNQTLDLKVNNKIGSEYKVIVGNPDYVEMMIEEIKRIIPAEFSLGNNYPNPFNPDTHLDYSLPKRGIVTLRIYNLVGQEVITILNEEKPFGNYSVRWNGLDHHGNSASSGVYFAELRLDNARRVTKMLLVK